MLDWARAQAGQCVRALRLEMLLLMVYYLQVRAAHMEGRKLNYLLVISIIR